METATISARLRLLDLQVVDSDGLPIGRVDDVELDRSPDGVSVVALACGQGALGRRLGGTVGRWLLSSAVRLRAAGPEADPPDGVTRIPAALVGELSSVVRLTRPMAELHGVAGLERWLTAHFIGRLPGAGEPPVAPRSAAPSPTPATVAGGLLLSRLLNAPVYDANRHRVGIVHDLRLEPGRVSGGAAVGSVRAVVVGGGDWRSRLAHAWGYAARPRSGPAALHFLVSAAASHARVVPVDQVRGWTDAVVIDGPLERYPTLHEGEAR